MLQNWDWLQQKGVKSRFWCKFGRFFIKITLLSMTADGNLCWERVTVTFFRFPTWKFQQIEQKPDKEDEKKWISVKISTASGNAFPKFVAEVHHMNVFMSGFIAWCDESAKGVKKAAANDTMLPKRGKSGCILMICDQNDLILVQFDSNSWN